MNISITQGNTQENVTSPLIDKLYKLATAEGNSLTLSGNLYSPNAYAHQVNYLNQQFGPNLTITVPEEGKYIYFEDRAVEAVLLAAGISTDGIGITQTDAADAVLTGTTFRGNTDITKFNEFKYFTKANTNPPQHLFRDCSNLEEIDLSNCTKIVTGEFNGCSSLTIDSSQLSNLTTFSDTAGAFRTVHFKDGIFKAPITTGLRFNSFNGAVDLTTIDLSEGRLSSIPDSLQMGDAINRVTLWKFPKNYFTQMQSYIVPSSGVQQFVYGLESLTDFGEMFFIRCQLQNPVGLKVYTGNYSPFQCSGNFNEQSYAHSLFFPKIQTTCSASILTTYNQPQRCFFDNAPWGNSHRFISELVYFKDITTFGLCTFFRTTIQNLVINNITPPTYDTTNISTFNGRDYTSTISNLFGDATIGTLWVPDSAVATYQANPLYSSLTIKGINTKTNGTNFDLPRFATIEDWQEAYDLSVENNTASPVGLIEEYM